jgi:hypothetical protein
MSVLLVSGVLVAALNSVGAASTSRQLADRRARGQLLAESLLTEVMATAYQDEDNLGTQGLETGEAGSDRTKYDDVDDYKARTDSPPVNQDGSAIAGFDNWSRTVTVMLVEPTNPGALALSDKGVKRIRVVVECNGAQVASLTGFKTRTDPVAGKTKGILIEVVEGLEALLIPGGGLLELN